MRLSLINITLLTVLCFAFLLSCEEPEDIDEATVPVPTAAKITDEVKEQFRSLGFDPSDLARRGDDYLVEGDMLISPETLSDILAKETTLGNGPVGEQYHSGRLVKIGRSVRTITVRPTDDGPRFVKAISRAISNFNRLDLGFRMKRVPVGSSSDIVVSRLEKTDKNETALARARYPSGGRPGYRVDVYAETFRNGYTDDFIEGLITHELGHCVGLAHTNWRARGEGGSGFQFIPGTAETDNQSIMNALIPIRTDGEFSAGDRKALRTIYPR